jgi:hypothetical protein
MSVQRATPYPTLEKIRIAAQHGVPTAMQLLAAIRLLMNYSEFSQEEQFSFIMQACRRMEQWGEFERRE